MHTSPAALLRPLFLIGALLTPTVVPAANACQPYHYVLGFFNGVWNLPDDANQSALALREVWQETRFAPTRHSGPALEVFYNQSGLRRGRSGALEDLVEVFAQRSRELNSLLAKEWERFWDLLEHDGAEALPWQGSAAVSLLRHLRDSAWANYVRWSSSWWAQPPTPQDYAHHQARITALHLQGKALYLTAHSQGNFFMQRLLQDPLALQHYPQVKALHLAPPLAHTQHPYVLSGNDAVIRALFNATPGARLAPNLSIPYSARDPSGHALLDTYLDPARIGRQAVRNAMQSAQQHFPPPTAKAAPGWLTATLVWDQPADLDLHVTEPDGQRVFYGRRSGNSGHLDLDDRIGTGPEHYHLSCDLSRVQAGRYIIAVNPYALSAPRTARLQIASLHHGVLAAATWRALHAQGSAGDAAPLPLYYLDVRHTPARQLDFSVVAAQP